MRVCFETFGCRLNRAEALEMEAGFIAAGWQKTFKHSDADLIVVRGCSVTARAQRDSERLIAHIRAKYPMKRIIVAGCLPDAGKSAKALRLPEKTGVPSSTARAYLKVQDGCDSQCSFCIVPKFRGKASSVPFAHCLDKAKAFAEAGYHELVVTGCNLVQYCSEGKFLPELVGALASLDPSVRVRVGSVGPGRVVEEFVDVMAENPNVCRFLHLSVQSGSTRILSAMRRGYTGKDLDEFLFRLERKLPDCGLGCDLITGFPGETDMDFAATLELVKRHRFNLLHVFPYSERQGTRAASFPDSIPPEMRKDRARMIAREGDLKRRSFVKSFLGKTVEVVVEDESKIAGWTSEYVWCEAINSLVKTVRRKDRVKVSVRTVRGETLSGAVV